MRLNDHPAFIHVKKLLTARLTRMRLGWKGNAGFAKKKALLNKRQSIQTPRNYYCLCKLENKTLYCQNLYCLLIDKKTLDHITTNR